MPNTLVFDVEEVGQITMRVPGWDDFAAWWDAVGSASVSDATNNLVIACAVTPAPAELATIFEDLGFLSASICAGLLARTGVPEGGFLARYPSPSGESVAAAHPELAEMVRKRTRRPLYVSTPAGLWALRPPSAPVAAAYQDAMNDVARNKAGSSAAQAARALVLGCVLSPEAEIARTQIEEHPAIPYILRDWLQELGGLGKAIARASS
jgi:hypothetical protein